MKCDDYERFASESTAHLFRKEMRRVVSGAVVRFETATWGFFVRGRKREACRGEALRERLRGIRGAASLTADSSYDKMPSAAAGSAAMSRVSESRTILAGV